MNFAEIAQTVEIDLIDEIDEIGLKNRSNLAQRRPLGSIWLCFGDIDKVNERNEGYAKRED